MSRQSKGIPIVNMLEIDKDETISTIIGVKDKDTEGMHLVFATKKGIVKRSSLDDFDRINKNGKIAITFKEDDELLAVRLTDGSKEIILGTKKGSLIRFEETQIRNMGRTAAGVRGIRLRDDDEVIGLDVLSEGQEILVVTSNGYGKRTVESEYRSANRGGMGVKTANLNDRIGDLVYIASVDGDEDLMIVTDYGVIIRLVMEEVSITGRNTQGVRLIRLADEHNVATVARVKEELEEEELVLEEDGKIEAQIEDEMEDRLDEQDHELSDEVEELLDDEENPEE